MQTRHSFSLASMAFSLAAAAFSGAARQSVETVDPDIDLLPARRQGSRTTRLDAIHKAIRKGSRNDDRAYRKHITPPAKAAARQALGGPVLV